MLTTLYVAYSDAVSSSEETGSYREIGFVQVTKSKGRGQSHSSVALYNVCFLR